MTPQPAWEGCSQYYWTGCAILFCHICSLAHRPHRKGSDYLDKNVRMSVWRADSSAGAQYCCDYANTTQTNPSLACIDGSAAFTLPDATLLLGVAGLLNATEVSSINSTSNAADTATPTAITAAYGADCSSQKKDTITVGSVLGVALLAVAIALIIWAVWERRQKVLWWQRATGLGPRWPPNNATWMRAPSQTSKPPPCPVARAKLLYAAHQEQKRAQEQAAEQPAPTYGAHQPGPCQLDCQQPMSQNQVSSPQRPREMPDGMPAAAEMDAT